jgi:hypothetical protein
MNPALVAAVVLVVGWFAWGTGLNVRRGQAALRWMQGGLKQIGDRTTLRWLGSTAAVLRIAEAKAPFSSAELVVFLEARDLPWMWALGRLRGRRDALIFRALLRRPPAEEFEALEPSSWSGREAAPRLPRGWSVLAPPRERDLAVHGARSDALARAEALLERARQAGLDVWRLSARRVEPHFQLHVKLPAAGTDAAAFFETVRALAEHASR